MRLNIQLVNDEKIRALAAPWLDRPVAPLTRQLAQSALWEVEMRCAESQQVSEDAALEVLFLRGFIAAFDKMQSDNRHRAFRHTQIDQGRST